MSKLRNLCIISLLGVVGAVVLYGFKDVEPIKSFLGSYFVEAGTFLSPYFDQAVVFLSTQWVTVQGMLSEYWAAAGTIIAASAGSIYGILKKRFGMKVQSITDAADAQMAEVGNELTRVIGVNSQLTIENSGIKARLEQLEDVETNMNVMKDQLAAKVLEVEQLTAERNEAERFVKNVVVPKVEELVVE